MINSKDFQKYKFQKKEKKKKSNGTTEKKIEEDDDMIDVCAQQDFFLFHSFFFFHYISIYIKKMVFKGMNDIMITIFIWIIIINSKHFCRF